MRLALVTMMFALGLPVIAGSPARGNDEPIDLSKLPGPVRRAAEQALPGLKVKEATKDNSDEGIVYTVIGVDAKGRDAEVEVTAEGQVLSISREIRLQDVPKVVMTALRAKLKGFKPSDAMAVYGPDKKIIEYWFDGKDEKGKEIEVTVSADGSSVEVEQDD